MVKQAGCVGKTCAVVVIILTVNIFGAKEAAAQNVPEISTEEVKNASNFLIIHNKALTPDQAYNTSQVLRPCECRRLCVVNPNCTAFSIHPTHRDGLLCYLTDHDVYTNVPHTVPDSIYYVKPDPQDILGPDNLFYRRLNQTVATLEEARKLCEDIPGFRLIVVWAKIQFPLLLRLCLNKESTTETDCNDGKKYFFVDIEKMNGNVMIQGKFPLNATDLVDGVHIEANEEGKNNFYYAHSQKLHDDNFGTQVLVCQANLFNVPW